MSSLGSLISELYGRPGADGARIGVFLRRAARAHRTLLSRAAAESPPLGGSWRSQLPRIGLLVDRLPRDTSDRLLLDPVFIEGLHAGALESPVLARWHEQLAGRSIDVPGGPPAGATGPGNSLAALLLRDDPHWQGRLRLRTDLFGRLRFPLSHWSIALWSRRDGPDNIFSQADLTASFGRRDVRLSLPGRPHDELLVVPRDDWLQLFLYNDAGAAIRPIRCAHEDVGLRLCFAGVLPDWRVRYDPIVMREHDRHAPLTGGLIVATLDALSHHAAEIAGEFDALMSAVRGWHIPSADYGTLQSFSDPTTPRVMGFNVSYTDRDEPQLCPFCFTWFGHELGHTKSYLIETILHARGASLTACPGRITEHIPRYGRSLAVRTLLQIPYTHLYELTLLIRFLQGRFSALPWTISGDPVAFGDDLQSEIEEAFEIIDREPSITEAGSTVMAHLHVLCAETFAEWRKVREYAAGGPLVEAVVN